MLIAVDQLVAERVHFRVARPAFAMRLLLAGKREFDALLVQAQFAQFAFGLGELGGQGILVCGHGGNAGARSFEFLGQLGIARARRLGAAMRFGGFGLRFLELTFEPGLFLGQLIFFLLGGAQLLFEPAGGGRFLARFVGCHGGHAGEHERRNAKRAGQDDGGGLHGGAQNLAFRSTWNRSTFKRVGAVAVPWIFGAIESMSCDASQRADTQVFLSRP